MVVDVTPSKILSSDVVELIPSKILSSVVDAVKPSNIFNSAVVTSETAILPAVFETTTLDPVRVLVVIVLAAPVIVACFCDSADVTVDA